MIYDYQDISTKYYLTASVRDWARYENNAMQILLNPKVKELTEADLSWNSEDDIVWTIMYLIGVGLLRYVIPADGTSFAIGLNLNWKKPTWLFDPESRKKINRHIDWMMELENEGRTSGAKPVALDGSLEIQKYKRFCLYPPREPVRDNLQHEKKIIAQNRQRLARKKASYRRKA